MKEHEWSKPKAISIPKEDKNLEQGRYGPILPKSPACYGFTIIARVKEGRADAIRAHGDTIANAIEAQPDALSTLKLHYLRWVLFDNDTRFMYQGIFDTDFDKYTEDAVDLFSSLGVTTAFENLEEFPMDWRTKPSGFVEFVRKFQCNSFLEYGEYPYVSSTEIKKALNLKAHFEEMLEQMQ